MNFHLINQRYNIRPGYLVVYQKPLCVYGELGSGLFVAIRDRTKAYSGCSFFLHPKREKTRENSVQYGNVAILHLIKKMKAYGSKNEDLEAFLIGASTKHNDYGERNIKIARTILKLRNIPIVSEDTGGKMGRKFIYDTSSGESITVKVNQLGANCWYPYQHNRRT